MCQQNQYPITHSPCNTGREIPIVGLDNGQFTSTGTVSAKPPIKPLMRLYENDEMQVY